MHFILSFRYIIESDLAFITDKGLKILPSMMQGMGRAASAIMMVRFILL
jgi:hypothetical protein